MNKILIIGPLPIERYNIYCGTTVLMKNFISFLDSQQKPYRFLQTNKYYNPKTERYCTIKNALYFLSMFIPNLLKCDLVMFNFSTRSTIKLVPFLTFLAKLLGKKVVIRKFAGTLEPVWKTLPHNKKNILISTFNHADLILLETKEGIRFLSNLIKMPQKILWFTNVRRPTSIRKKAISRMPKKFVFISLVVRTKGVFEMIESFNQLGNDYTLDIYGKIEDPDLTFLKHSKLSNIQYKGELSNTLVLNTLSNYDVLLLPSYTEGYPGILIEAMSIGLPFITTNVGGIPEIVKHKFNGIIINPKSSEELTNAIQTFTVSEYNEISKNQIAYFNKNFNSDTINTMIYEKINTL